MGTGNGRTRRGAALLVAALVLGLLSAAPALGAFDFLGKFGTTGTGNGQLDGPAGVTVDPAGNVYVAEYENNRISKFGPDGTFLLKFGTAGSGDGQFDSPTDVAVDTAGNIYVADNRNHRIQKFEPDGDFIAKFGSNGTGNGQFKRPFGLDIDPAGNIYVADGDNHRVQKFEPDFDFITRWGRNGGDGTAGTGNGEFNTPVDVSVDANSRVYVTDFENDRVQKFTSSGVFLGSFGTVGTGDGQFNGPAGIDADVETEVHVADYGNDRIQVFSNAGVFVRKFGSGGTGNGQFDQPWGVALDCRQNVWVGDFDNDRIQKFGETTAPPPPCPPVAPPPDANPPPQPPPAADREGPEVSISRLSLNMSDTGRVRVRLTCPSDEISGCTGTVRIRTVGRYRVTRRGGRVQRNLASGDFELNPGQRRSASIRISSRRLRSLVRRLVRTRVTVIVRAEDPAGNLEQNTRRVTLNR